MNDTRPLVSIVVPAYNAESYLVETLDSLLAEGYPNTEIIVVNDGSHDATPSIASDYAQRHSHIIAINQPNGGVCRARNKGIAQAHGKYILPVDADDLLLPGFITWAVDIMEKHPDAKVAVPKAEFFGAKSGEWHLPHFSLRLLARKNMIPATALYRRTDWERVGGYYETLQAREDWEFWIHMLKDGGQVYTSPQVGLRYRIHKGSKRTTDRQLKKQIIHALNERHPEFFQHQLGGPLHYHRSWSRILNALHRILYPHHLTIANEFRQAKDFFLALPSVFRTNRGEVIYKRRNEIRRISFKGCEYVVKAFHMPNLLNRIVYGFLRPSKAKRSYRYSLLLQQQGIGVPTPVAYYSERFLGLFFGRSYYVSLLSPLPYTYNDIVNGNLSPSDEEDFLKAIGLTTARLHNAGMIHHDYSRGNLLLGKNAEGKACVELIDLNRLRFHEISMDEGCQNFAERLPATDVQRHTMAEAYAKERGFDVERCYELMMKYNKEKT